MFSRVRYGWPAFTGLSIAAAVAAGIVEWAGLAFIFLLIHESHPAMSARYGMGLVRAAL